MSRKLKIIFFAYAIIVFFYVVCYNICYEKGKRNIKKRQSA